MSDMAAYYATAKTIHDFWIGKGCTPNHAAGWLTQADAESSLNPKAVGDHGKSFGLHQLRDPRLALIKAGCGIDNYGRSGLLLQFFPGTEI